MVSPLVFLLMAIKFNYIAIERTVVFWFHGGEWINFDENDKATVKELLDELKKNKNNEN